MMSPEQKFDILETVQGASPPNWGIFSGVYGWIAIQPGIVGRLGVFVWSLAMVTLVPANRLPLATALCLVAAVLVHPRAIKRAFSIYRLVFLALMALPPMFFLESGGFMVLGLEISQQGLVLAMQIVLRFVVIVVSVDGFTSFVDISAIAGLLERFGLRGLGFSLGVALNLLPSFRRSAINAWDSLLMRGGFRKQRWLAIQLLLTTIVSNAIRRAEDISLAAESRAFSLENTWSVPIDISPQDPWIVVGVSCIFWAFAFF